jgi:hypothetical protein
MRHSRFDRIPWLLLTCALALQGCVYGRYTGDVEENPVADTGVGAAVIMPGQSAPVMIPGGGYAPGGNAECQNGPNGQSCASGGTVAPSPSNITMIGGTEEDIENHIQAKEDPLMLKWLAVPFALLAAPFSAAAEAARGEPETGPAVPQEKTPRPEAKAPEVQNDNGAGSPAPQAQAAPPQSYESQSLQQMEHELDRQLADQQRTSPEAAPTRAGVSLPSQRTPATAAGGSSIADELAALQRSPSAPEPRRETAPAPVESRSEAPAPRQAQRESDVADGIVDRDEDGRIDLWIYRQDGEIVRKVLDQDFDGQPDTTLRYDPKTHQLARVEEDDDHDGVTDGWTDYRDGKIARRRADADRDGLADTWTFYRDGEIHRHEQDTNGDGFRDRVGFYEDGRVVREEQDSNADGVADVTSFYDERERVIRREEDKNLDGRIDEINHYENGRLARKELLGAPDSVVP